MEKKINITQTKRDENSPQTLHLYSTFYNAGKVLGKSRNCLAREVGYVLTGAELAQKSWLVRAGQHFFQPIFFTNSNNIVTNPPENVFFYSNVHNNPSEHKKRFEIDLDPFPKIDTEYPLPSLSLCLQFTAKIIQ